jgi:hypothetical protein
MSDKMVYISKRGRKYHESAKCPWWMTARNFSEDRGWHVYEPEQVSLSSLEGKRLPCRICVPREDADNE